MMEFTPHLDPAAAVPLYRQLYEEIAERIRSRVLAPGSKLPATRELAGLLGLNRTTVSAAYELLENEGLISGQVGRGSFVTGEPHKTVTAAGVEWRGLLERNEPALSPHAGVAGISFAMSRPSRELFPLDEFRASCEAVLSRTDLADILQLGSPGGYEPLRRYLLQEAKAQGVASTGDDLLITNGCQQALDLIGRVLLRPGDAVAVEDPVYTGLKNLLAGMGARLIAIPVGTEGLDAEFFDRLVARERPRFVVVTPNFQNPTGTTMPLTARQRLLESARTAGIPVIENDAYGDLRYRGESLPPLKQLDELGGTVLLRSFSKVSFPGLRVGWALGPKPLIDRLRQAKEACDLHSDHLSQAVLLEFAESGRLEAHRRRILQAGLERLEATLAGCRDFLPAGSRWTRPDGGMNIWVTLPAPLDSAALLERVQREGVSYLPGRYFAVSRAERGALRLSFAGLSPEQVRKGLEVIGRISSGEAKAAAEIFEPAPAMV